MGSDQNPINTDFRLGPSLTLLPSPLIRDNLLSLYGFLGHDRTNKIMERLVGLDPQDIEGSLPEYFKGGFGGAIKELHRGMDNVGLISHALMVEALERHLMGINGDYQPLLVYVNRVIENKGNNPRFRKFRSSQRINSTNDIDHLELWHVKQGFITIVDRLGVHLKDGRIIYMVVNAAKDPQEAATHLKQASRAIQEDYSWNPRHTIEVFSIQDIAISTRRGQENLTIMLGEWLEDFHELHLQWETQDHFNIWWDQGWRVEKLSREESDRIWQQIVRLRAIYLRENNGQTITAQGHLNAGDFVGRRCSDGTWEVMMIWSQRPQEKKYSYQEGILNGLLVSEQDLLAKSLNGLSSRSWWMSENLAIPAFVQGMILRDLERFETEQGHAAGPRIAGAIQRQAYEKAINALSLISEDSLPQLVHHPDEFPLTARVDNFDDRAMIAGRSRQIYQETQKLLVDNKALALSAILTTKNVPASGTKSWLYLILLLDIACFNVAWTDGIEGSRDWILIGMLVGNLILWACGIFKFIAEKESKVTAESHGARSTQELSYARRITDGSGNSVIEERPELNRAETIMRDRIKENLQDYYYQKILLGNRVIFLKPGGKHGKLEIAICTVENENRIIFETIDPADLLLPEMAMPIKYKEKEFSVVITGGKARDIFSTSGLLRIMKTIEKELGEPIFSSLRDRKSVGHLMHRIMTEEAGDKGTFEVARQLIRFLGKIQASIIATQDQASGIIIWDGEDFLMGQAKFMLISETRNLRRKDVFISTGDQIYSEWRQKMRKKFPLREKEKVYVQGVFDFYSFEEEIDELLLRIEIVEKSNQESGNKDKDGIQLKEGECPVPAARVTQGQGVFGFYLSDEVLVPKGIVVISKPLTGKKGEIGIQPTSVMAPQDTHDDHLSQGELKECLGTITLLLKSGGATDRVNLISFIAIQYGAKVFLAAALKALFEGLTREGFTTIDFRSKLSREWGNLNKQEQDLIKILAEIDPENIKEPAPVAISSQVHAPAMTGRLLRGFVIWVANQTFHQAKPRWFRIVGFLPLWLAALLIIVIKSTWEQLRRFEIFGHYTDSTFLLDHPFDDRPYLLDLVNKTNRKAPFYLGTWRHIAHNIKWFFLKKGKLAMADNITVAKPDIVLPWKNSLDDRLRGLVVNDWIDDAYVYTAKTICDHYYDFCQSPNIVVISERNTGIVGEHSDSTIYGFTFQYRLSKRYVTFIDFSAARFISAIINNMSPPEVSFTDWEGQTVTFDGAKLNFYNPAIEVYMPQRSRMWLDRFSAIKDIRILAYCVLRAPQIIRSYDSQGSWEAYVSTLLPALLPENYRNLQEMPRCAIGMHLKKCLVLDADGVLWGGVAGEDGAKGIQLSSDFLEFQRMVHALNEQGVILAINSKSNTRDIEAILRMHLVMKLSYENFAFICADSNDKVTHFRAIAQRLNIGLDSMVFLDDSPQERDLVRRTLPEVLTPEFPEDGKARLRLLEELKPLFLLGPVTDEDLRRSELYAARDQRETAREHCASLKDFHSSLGMKAEVREGRQNVIIMPGLRN